LLRIGAAEFSYKRTAMKSTDCGSSAATVTEPPAKRQRSQPNTALDTEPGKKDELIKKYILF
jgi:hypothetical protein